MTGGAQDWEGTAGWLSLACIATLKPGASADGAALVDGTGASVGGLLTGT